MNDLFSGNFKLESQAYSIDDSIPELTPAKGEDKTVISQSLPTIGIEPVETIEDNTTVAPVTDPVVEEPKETSTETKFSFLPFIDHFGEKGLLSKAQDKTYEDSEEGFEQALSDTIEARWQKKLEELDPFRKELLGLAEEGLDARKYADIIDFSKVDMSDLDNQRDITLDYLEAHGKTPEQAKAIVDRYEEAGMLEDQSQIALSFLAKAQNDYIETEKAKERAAIKAQQDKAALEHENIKKEILGLKKLGNFDLPEGEGQALYDYIYKPVKNGKSQSQIDGDKQENRLLLAFFMKHGFNTESIQKIADTKTARNLREKLSHFVDKNAKPVDNGNPEARIETNKLPDFSFLKA